MFQLSKTNDTSGLASLHSYFRMTLGDPQAMNLSLGSQDLMMINITWKEEYFVRLQQLDAGVTALRLRLMN